MPAEPDDPVVLVPLEPIDGGSATGETRQGSGGSRKRWWWLAAVAGALLVAAVVVSSQFGSDTGGADTDVAEEEESDAGVEPDRDAAASSPDEAEVTETPAADSAPTEQPDQGAAADEPTDVDADDDAQVSAELSEAFGEPEHPVSGVEPYIPSRVRVEELGPPADVCRGAIPARRIQLPLRFASTKPEGVDQLSWSPDCRRMVFRVGSTLWVADGDGTGDMPFLTAQHGLSAPVWSPDGEWIAFSQGAIVDGERVRHIYVVRPDALGLAQVTDGVVLDYEPAWSPDGTRLVFSRLARAVDGAETGEFDQYIVIVELSTGAEQVLMAGGEYESSASWSPNGELIAYRVGDSLRMLRLDDSAEFDLLDGAEIGGGGSWSTDGSRLAAIQDWLDGGATIVVSDLPGLYPGDQHVIAVQGLELASPGVVPALQWSVDGQRLILHASEAPGSHWAYSIVVPPPARSAEYWAMLEVVEAVVREAGYEVAAVQHSVAVEAEFSVRGRAALGVIEVWIAFERSEPRRFFDAVENPHSDLPGIRRSPERVGVWFECDGVYGEALAASQAVADALAADVMSAACPSG